MSSQPDDGKWNGFVEVLHISLVLLGLLSIIRNDDEFDGLGESLKMSIYSQGDNNVFLTTDEEQCSSPVDRLIQTGSNERRDEAFLREAFPDAVLPNSPLINLTEGTF